MSLPGYNLVAWVAVRSALRCVQEVIQAVPGGLRAQNPTVCKVPLLLLTRTCAAAPIGDRGPPLYLLLLKPIDS